MPSGFRRRCRSIRRINARIPSDGEVFAGISEPPTRHSAEVVTNFEATEPINDTR
jgi:hypothetical protein